MYKTYIRPRLTYAAPAWYQLVAETHRRKLRAQQALSLRTVVDAPRYVRNCTIQRDLKIDSLDDFISTDDTKPTHRDPHASTSDKKKLWSQGTARKPFATSLTGSRENTREKSVSVQQPSGKHLKKSQEVCSSLLKTQDSGFKRRFSAR
ncbi:hypothetical protein JYU34_018290 [Plutella xylostella]|uniref:Uncharacterized protein n=1 Tax=Plutella xylostella TaxID=51655 RepID=A0ABQ7Q082_PLUXY|nr:hypothetical protein JYU34_018290 [Plutella xylostella]